MGERGGGADEGGWAVLQRLAHHPPSPGTGPAAPLPPPGTTRVNSGRKVQEQHPVVRQAHLTRPRGQRSARGRRR
jgi:hypothetical protein